MALTHAEEIVDDYEHPDENVEYVLENLLQEQIDQCEEFSQLREQYNSVLLKPCQCDSAIHGCKSDDCLHGGNYILLNDELVLNPEIKSDLIYECSALCTCRKSECHNRLVQNGPRKYLKVIQSKVYKSLGLITDVYIPKGGFICEYAGELLTRTETQRRLKENKRNRKMNYILCLNERLVKSETDETRQCTIIDPSRRGNIGRYLNHSCAPNCEIYSVRVDCPIPKIAIFAKCEIPAGAELCFHYGDESKTSGSTVDKTPCLCRSINCLKYLPNVQF